MHIKCIYELCSLLDHISLFIIVYWCHGHAFHWFRGFSKQSPFLVLNPQYKKPHLCIFLSFRDLSDVKRTQSFYHIIFQEIEDREKKRSTRRSTRQERGGTTQAPPLAMWWAPTSPSWTLLQLCSPLRNHLDLKPTIYMTPPGLFHDGAAKQRIHNTDMKTARIGGKTLPSFSQLSLRLQWHNHHDEKGVVHHWTMRLWK
jgi:hypothetical protein